MIKNNFLSQKSVLSLWDQSLCTPDDCDFAHTVNLTSSFWVTQLAFKKNHNRSLFPPHASSFILPKYNKSMQGIWQIIYIYIKKHTGNKMPNNKTMQSCVCVKARQHHYISRVVPVGVATALFVWRLWRMQSILRQSRWNKLLIVARPWFCRISLLWNPAGRNLTPLHRPINVTDVIRVTKVPLCKTFKWPCQWGFGAFILSDDLGPCYSILTLDPYYWIYTGTKSFLTSCNPDVIFS